MGIHLYPDGHAQEGEGRHENIGCNFFRPGDPRTEKISQDDIGRDNDQLKSQKDACQKSADVMNDIEDRSYIHGNLVPPLQIKYKMSRLVKP
jgi:hypothetical protein